MDNSPLPMCVASVSLGLPHGNLRRPRASAPDGVQSVSGHGRGVARPIAVWRTILPPPPPDRRRPRRFGKSDLAGAIWQGDLAGATWQERHARIAACSGLSQCHPGRGRGQRKAGTRFRRTTLCSTNAALPSRQIALPAAPPQLAQHRLAMTWQ